MGYVSIDRRIGTKIADMFGPQITEEFAERIMVKAQANAESRAKHSSVADRIDLSVHHHGTDHTVVMSVWGKKSKTGTLPNVAAALEWGYYNVQAGRRIEGEHIMRDAAFGGGL